MLDNFYAEVKKISRATGELSGTNQAVVLVRVAIEESTREVGFAPTMHLLSKMLTTSLEVMAEDEGVSLEDTLDGLNVDGLTPN
mgnify:FL=1|jgi:hypothetical protein